MDNAMPGNASHPDDTLPIDPALLQQLDACRPGQRDHELPEMADLAKAFAASPRWTALRREVASIDRAVMAELREVDVPPGLAASIQTQLDEAVASGKSAPATAAASGAGSSSVALRRRWLAGSAAALVACAATGLVAWFAWPATVDLGPEAIMNLARAACGRPGQMVVRTSEGSPPARFGWGEFITARRVLAWRQLRGELLDRDGVVYDLLGHGQERATLFVVEARGPLGAPAVEHLPRRPTETILTTAGSASAVWTDGTRLFVLVVAGDASALRAFVRESGAIA
ncbi:MAG TPA: hypothetical protein VHZ24_18820 [Pirellulales bacterium]|jgi:hypothetical protein|nr:hypothetical protein [Pirellulales bacterium]